MITQPYREMEDGQKLRAGRISGQKVDGGGWYGRWSVQVQVQGRSSKRGRGTACASVTSRARTASRESMAEFFRGFLNNYLPTCLGEARR